MKTRFVVLLTLFMYVSMHAQAQTLIGDNFSSGGYGGPVIKVGYFNGKTGLVSGGRGAWIINHKLAIGGGSYSSISDIKSETVGNNGNTLYTEINYGGFELEYIHNSDRVLHWTINTMIGGGTVKLLEHHPTNTIEKDKISIVEPGFNLNVNINRWLRIGLGASYRICRGLDLELISDSGINGFSGMIDFKFGRF